ncbi:hypothetical protein L618_000400002520 [Rhodococcus rhodochrous J45]|uniref:Uncharacterized protein n=1 Tax=Rhodococcus rhodochrous J45 TaxID=935266 RepID=A0A562DM75_RHORH|nr:hypothetical protein [Rhodococcus rhodochrous]TWH10771.1 hypothetical protein L618_000400002520 [Rhodococcus rhodochrous J45]
MKWQPLSQRMRGLEPDGPYEGVPQHLVSGLVSWLDETLRGGAISMRGDVIRSVAINLRVPLPPFGDDYACLRTLFDYADTGDDAFLDVVDATLKLVGSWSNNHATLRTLLASAASVWTVGEDDESLVRVVSSEMQGVYESAVEVADEPAKELREAWANAFGRNGNPSDAWDHAIKALEDTLIPIVVPKKAKANLGSVIGVLASQQSSGQWQMLLPGHELTHDVAPLVAMLRLVWPNHDRHGGPGAKRAPSEAEARAVVTIVATIIQWSRQGWVVQKR